MTSPTHRLHVVRAPGIPADGRLRLAELRAPRYTSYPTALEFSAAVDSRQLIDEIRQTNQEPIPAPLSLYLHLPFCASACFYCGCHRIVSRNSSRHDDYLALLEREIAIIASQIDRDRPVAQIHLGGGTPNTYRPLQLARLMRALSRHFSISPGCEISMEVDPRQYRSGDAAAWKALGFNRLSLGIQDVSATVQRAINRIQPVQTVVGLVEQARAAGIAGINFDLIYGLPEQSLAGVDDNLSLVGQLQPDRVAVFHYAHLPERFRAQRAMNPQRMPDGATRLAMQSRYAERLSALGYRHIGLDHFALPHDSLARALAKGSLQRNFQGYSTLGGCDIIGLGLSAISSVGRIYAQNHPGMDAYRQAIDVGHPATARGYRRCDEDLLRHAVIQQIMCRRHLHFADIMPNGGFARHFADDLRRLHALDPQGRLVRLTSEALSVLPAGHHALRLIAQCFDQHAHHRADRALTRAV